MINDFISQKNDDFYFCATFYMLLKSGFDLIEKCKNCSQLLINYLMLELYNTIYQLLFGQ